MASLQALTYGVTLELRRDFPELQQNSEEYAQRFSEAIDADLIRDPAALPDCADAPPFFLLLLLFVYLAQCVKF